MGLPNVVWTLNSTAAALACEALDAGLNSALSPFDLAFLSSLSLLPES